MSAPPSAMMRALRPVMPRRAALTMAATRALGLTLSTAEVSDLARMSGDELRAAAREG